MAIVIFHITLSLPPLETDTNRPISLLYHFFYKKFAKLLKIT